MMRPRRVAQAHPLPRVVLTALAAARLPVSAVRGRRLGLVLVFGFGAGGALDAAGALPAGEPGRVVLVLVVDERVEASDHFVRLPEGLFDGGAGVHARAGPRVL